jgi:flavin-dependent dehydrogenase
MLSQDPQAKMSALLLEHKELADRLAGQASSSVERGAVTGTRRLRRVTKNNVLLIGDASGTVDAITGEGMRLGFEHAIAAVDAIISGDLRHYERKHRQIAARPSAMACLLQALNTKPRLRAKVLRALGEAPELFKRLLALHIGESTFSQSLLAGVGLSWKLLFA